MEDRALIEQFTQHGSERAFAELTQRYESFVFSTALRQVRDADLARDVVQNVFLCLARKAGALDHEPVLIGWLGRAAHFEALKVLRERRRRTLREDAYLAENTAEPEQSPRQREALVEQTQAALLRLAEKDRHLLLLRFAEAKSLKETASLLGISEDAAQKRISRALEKLRTSLRKTGISTAALATLLGAPAFSASGISAAASSAGTSLFVTLSSLLAMTKLKVAAITCAVAAVTATPFVIDYLRDDPVARPTSESMSAPAKETVSAKDRELAAARTEADTLRAEIASLRSELAAAGAKPQTTAQPEPDSIAALKKRAIDPRNDPHDRLKALGELRDRNGRDAQVASAMAALARTTTDPAIRADIFRQLSGMRDPSLKPVLLEALKRDASDEVRSEAAETLAAYATDSDVQALLLSVSRSDSDAEVRGQAVESLVKNAPADLLQRMQNDPQATDLEVYHSTSALRKQRGADNAQAAALLHVLKATGIPDLRKDIVEDLGKHYMNIPEVTEWMDHLAQTEQDPKVRREAAKFSSKQSK